MLLIHRWILNNINIIWFCQTHTCILCSFTNSSSCSATAFPYSGIRNNTVSLIECGIAKTSSKCPLGSSIWMHPIYKEQEHSNSFRQFKQYLFKKKMLNSWNPKTRNIYIQWMCWLNKLTFCMSKSDPYDKHSHACLNNAKYDISVYCMIPHQYQFHMMTYSQLLK